MAEIKFEIQSQLGSIFESPKGWKKELNLISWNNKEPNTIQENGHHIIREWERD